MIEIALFQPDIAPNAATIIRMAACFGLKVTIIEPAGFAWTDSSFRRAGLDYLDRAVVQRCRSWQAFREETQGRRRVLVSTKAEAPYSQFNFTRADIILMGQESAGVPQEVHDAVEARILIPMKPGERSLNVSLACAMVTGEALRQTASFPNPRAL
ncbi:MAG TPA: tRNA (cytidine(34)-2'-O)-methyltransferase [Aestuariivirga sp.]|jgi:tRNA (cytidine/uridine-2'-O-)-methyltransferase